MPKKKLEKVATTSEPIANENLVKLRKVFPQFVKDGEIDFDALQTFFDKEGILAGEEKYGLNWAGKSDAFKAIRTSATGTLTPQPKESKDWDKTQNLFIEGDNLEVLKLLQKHYRDSIKMIYIDPPYNTGKDFIYKDNFRENVSDYYERTGQTKGGIKMTTNTESSGRYHSDWLTMMYPRLFLGRNLLRDDGVMFVSIDDNEVHNLRMIMDEIFGEENFVGDIIWNSTKSVTNTALVSVSHTYNLVYARNIQYYIKNRSDFRFAESGDGFSNPDNDPRGQWKADPFQVGGWRPNQQYEITNPKTGKAYKPNSGCSWKNDYKRFKELLADNRIVFGVSGKAGPQRKRFLSEARERGRVSTTLWTDVDTTTDATRVLDDLLGGNYFNNPKPVELIEKFIQLCTSSNDFILDFFSGSGTTAHAVMAQNAEDGGNRKWICVQLPEETDKDSEARKAGYKTIADIARERIRRAARVIAKDKKDRHAELVSASVLAKKQIPKQVRDDANALDVGFKSFALSPSNYRQWNVLTDKDDEATLKKQMKLIAEKPLVDKYDEAEVVFEILLKEGFSLNAEVVRTKPGKAPRGEKKPEDLLIWRVIEGERRMYISFAKSLTQKQVESLGLPKDTLFVCLDSALDDSTKVNIGRGLNVKVI